MLKTNLAKRLITCLIGIPLLWALIFLLPQHNFIGFSLLIYVFGLLGSFEISQMIFKKKILLSYVSSLLIPLTFFFSQYTELFFTAFVLIILLYEIKAGEKNSFESSVTDISKYLLILIYPSYLLTFLIRFMQCKATNEYALLLFLFLIFSNDIFAYVFGMLFGRNNAGILKASPKKSIAGFTGGTVACIAIGFLFFELFGAHLINLSSYEKFFLFLLTSILANIGDLAESVLKRSCNTKDSGNLIPGRGGVLDCMDSIIAAAPLFYLVFRI